MTTAEQRPAGWNPALAEYTTAMRAANRSPQTIRLYRHYLTGFALVHRSPWTATRAHMEAYVGNEAWSAQTRKSARSALCSFFRYAHGRGWLDDDPAMSLPGITVPRGHARPAPEFIVRQLMRDRHPERIIFMVLMAAELGMRCAEIARVHADDYIDDGDLSELVVHGKGGKTRVVPVVSDRLRARLAKVEGWAFPNGRGSHLSPGHVTVLLSKHLPGNFTGHQLRHRCATVQYGATRDLLAVGAFLGHSRPETTQRYVKMPDDALRLAAAASAL